MNQPYVSILVPIKNEAKNIGNCLALISGQHYPKDKMEVLVIDGGSSDASESIVSQFKETASFHVHFYTDKLSQRSTGLNLGIQHAKGEVILRVDARTSIPDDYIQKCVETLFSVNADNVGGIQRPIVDGNISKKQATIGYAMSHPFGVGNAQFRVGKKSGEVDSVYLGCFRKEVFQKIGLFDEQSSIITEDSDINYRIRVNGGKVYLNKDIVAYYSPRDTFYELAKLYYRYGGARAGFMLKWKTLTSVRQLVPPVFLLLVLGLPLASLYFTNLIYCWILMLAVYFATDVFFAASISIKNKKNYLFSRLILTFPVMHFSWAAGFWARLFTRRAIAS